MAGTGEEDQSRHERCSSHVRRRNVRTPCAKKRIGSMKVISFAYLDDLDDYLLVEVLQRLPTAKSAVSCKSVSKRWCSLISSEYFIRRFIIHHAYKNLAAANVGGGGGGGGHSFNCLVGTSCRKSNAIILSDSTIVDEPFFKSCGINLTFLPEENESVLVLASSFNDLLLCGVNRGGVPPRYYVCNPYTRQYLAVSPIPAQGAYDSNLYEIVSEPFSLQNNHGVGEYTIHHEYRFRVLRARFVGSKTYTLETYSSEKNEWTKSLLSGAEYCRASNAVPYNGRLHWFNGKNVFAYDPFDARRSSALDGSEFRFRRPGDFGEHCLGVCQGRLRIMQLLLRSKYTLTVWELKNYATWDWSLVHKVNLKTMVFRNHLLFELIREIGIIQVAPLGFHTNNGDIVYLHFRRLVFSCNLRTRKLEFVTQVSAGNRFHDSRNFYPIMLPLWPTPLSNRLSSDV